MYRNVCSCVFVCLFVCLLMRLFVCWVVCLLVCLFVLTKNEQKMRFFVLRIFDGVIQFPISKSWWIPATLASTTQNIGCPSMTPSQMAKSKYLILSFILQVKKKRAILRLRSLFVKTDWVCHVWCNF